MAGSAGSGLVGLCLQGASFALSRNWLSLGGALGVSKAPDVKASEILKIKDMLNTSTLLGKPLDITESQISHLKTEIIMCFSHFKKLTDNRCEGILKTLNLLIKIFYFFIKNSLSRKYES